MRSLIKAIRAGGGRRSFDAQIATVLRGIAADQGLDWDTVEAALGDAAAR